MNYNNNNNNSCDDSNSIILGNSIVVDTNCNASEIKADIKVAEFDSLRLWGQVLNCNCQGVSNVLVKLVRIICTENGEKYQGIAHTISDCNGFYQFEICREDRNFKYKVLVSKAATGPEVVYTNTNGECNSCNNQNGFNPCKEYQPIIHNNNYDTCEPKNNCSCHNHQTERCNQNGNYRPNCNGDNNQGMICPKCGSNSGNCNCKTSKYTASNQCGNHV